MHVYSESKKTNAELQPTNLFTHAHLYSFTWRTRRHDMHLHKSKGKSHPHRQGWQTGPWTKCAWNLDERPGPRDRRVLPAPSWRDGGKPQCQRNAPDSVFLAWPVSSLRRSPRRHVFHGWHHGWGGERTGLPALSQREWRGELLMPGMGKVVVEALS